jgi:uncharacterized iron-regulated membrane protein
MDNSKIRTGMAEGMKQKKKSWQKIRKFFNDIHLWLGLISGIVVVAICFSGTIYTYNTELQEWAASHLYRVKVPENAQKISVEKAIEKVRSMVEEGSITGIYVPSEAGRTYQVSLRPEGDKSRFGIRYFVDPYSGEVLGDSNEKTKTGEFMSTMFSLHRWLLLDKIEKPVFGELPNRKLGSYITGTATILFTLGLITGLIIWFPRKVKNWRQGLKIKWQAGWKRINHDLHNTLAFYSLVFLLVMGITGPQWSFEWYRTGLRKALGTYEERSQPERKGDNGTKDRQSSESTQEGNKPNKPVQEVNNAKIPVVRYISATDELLPYKGEYRITFPGEGAGPVVVNKKRVGFFAPAASDRVTFDPYTSAVKEVTIFRDQPLNQRITGSIKALHTGEVFGGFTKLLYFLACLIATTLPVTGTIIWINKLGKKTKKKLRSRQEL